MDAHDNAGTIMLQHVLKCSSISTHLCITLLSLTWFELWNPWDIPTWRLIQKEERWRKVLNDIRTKGAMHVSIPEPCKDPEYVVSWYNIAVAQGLDIILPDLPMFKWWGDFLLDNSRLTPYNKPDKQDCYHGPNARHWLITQCHQINFGVSEDENGDVVKHNGVWFC